MEHGVREEWNDTMEDSTRKESSHSEIFKQGCQYDYQHTDTDDVGLHGWQSAG